MRRSEAKILYVSDCTRTLTRVLPGRVDTISPCRHQCSTGRCLLSLKIILGCKNKYFEKPM